MSRKNTHTRKQMLEKVVMHILRWECECSPEHYREIVYTKVSTRIKILEQGLELELASVTLHVDCTVCMYIHTVYVHAYIHMFGIFIASRAQQPNNDYNILHYDKYITKYVIKILFEYQINNEPVKLLYFTYIHLCMYVGTTKH